MSHSRFDRPMGQRKALMRGLVTSLLKAERIETTVTKAKTTQMLSEKMITLAKEDNLASRRKALAYLYDEDVVTKLFETLGPRYAHRQGGYTRILETHNRRGDGAPMAILELIKPSK